MKNWTVFIDMDGVVADFVVGALKAHHFTDEAIMMTLREWPYAEFNMPKVLGMDSKTFWGAIHEDVWANLQPYNGARALVKAVENLVGEDNVYFLSSPTIDPKCLSGKGNWLIQHFPRYWYTRHFVFTPHKKLFANSRTILIDDYCKNCEDFGRAGGWSILYPQKWNKLANFEGDKVEHTLSGIENITYLRRESFNREPAEDGNGQAASGSD